MRSAPSSGSSPHEDTSSSSDAAATPSSRTSRARSTSTSSRSLEFRQRTIAERDGLDAAAAKQAVERAARGRQSYHRQLFRCDADDPAMYGLTLNAGSLSPDAMVRTIRAAATATTVAAV